MVRAGDAAAGVETGTSDGGIALLMSAALLGVALSYLGSGLLLKFAGRYVPEIALAIAFLGWWSVSLRFRTFVSEVLRSPIGMSLLVVAAAQILLGAYRPDIDPLALYSTLRAYGLFLAAIAAGAVLFRARDNDACAPAIIVFALCSAGASALYSMLDLAGSVKSQIPVVAAALGFALALERRWYGWATMAVVILVIAAIFGFYRQYAVLAAACVLLLAVALFPVRLGWWQGVPKIYINGRHALMGLGLMLLAGCATLFFGEAVMAFLSRNASSYGQAMGKWTELWSAAQRGFVAPSELARLDGFDYFRRNAMVYLLPNGVVDSASERLTSIWGGETYFAPGVVLVRDSMFAVSVLYIGLPATAALCTGFVWVAAGRLIAARTREERCAFLAVAAALVMSFFADGMAVTSIEKAGATGLAIAYLATSLHRQAVRLNPAGPD